MFAPSKINDFFAYLQKNYDGDYEFLIKEREQKELILLENISTYCHYDKLSDRKITENEIEAALNEGFGDANILTTLLCVNTSTLLLPNKSKNFIIRNYIENLYVKSESTSGLAMNAQFLGNNGQYDTQFVIKAPKPYSDVDDTLHEYFVGVYGTNRLRSLIPNFAFVLGGFKCSPPYYDKLTNTNKVLTFCQNNKEQVYYIIYENVRNSVPLSKYLRVCTFKQFLNVFVQILFALQVAYENIDFTHYDLHTDNVLIRKLDKEIILPYIIKNKTYYLKTDVIATIIDFGRSHIKYENKSYGYYGVALGIYSENAYPMQDIFKILLFSLFDSVAINRAEVDRVKNNLFEKMDDEIFPNYGTQYSEVYNQGRRMLRLFYEDFILDESGDPLNGMSYILQLLNIRFTLPYLEKMGWEPIDFYNLIYENFYAAEISQFVSDTLPQNMYVYGCQNTNTCLNFENAIERYTQNIDMLSDTPYIYIENYMKLKNEERDDDKFLQFIEYGRTKYDEFMIVLKGDYEILNNDINESMRKIRDIYQLRDIDDYEILFSDVYIEIYRKFLANVVNIVELFTVLIFNIKVQNLLQNIFGTRKTQHNQKKNIDYVNKIIKSIREDYNFLKRLPKKYQNRIEKLNWFEKAINLLPVNINGTVFDSIK